MHSPLKITLEFLHTKKQEEPRDFLSERQSYRAKLGKGQYKSVSIPWDDITFKQRLDESEGSNPDPVVFEDLGRRLRDILRTTDWGHYEADIEKALHSGTPIDITLRSDAEELYRLPWELLALERNKRQLSEVPECLIRYEWLPEALKGHAPHPDSRILFASSTAGGDVPFEDHLKALQQAVKNSGFTFDLQNDVLRETSRKSLGDALKATGRPIMALHLLCHGASAPNGACGIMLHPPAPDGSPDLLDATDFRRILTPEMTLPRLVILCACKSGDAGPPAHILGSIARTLHQLGVPAVIASRFPLSIPGSNILTETLYAELLGPGASGNLRTALSKVRHRLMSEQRTRDWASLQFYAREDDNAALYPFRDPPPPAPAATSSRPRDLVLIRHSAYVQATATLGPADAPALFDHRNIRKHVFVDQAHALSDPRKQTRKNLAAAVNQLVAQDGDFMQALLEPDAELVYYGFPLVPLGVLAGFLAKTQRVRLFEYDRDEGRFTWVWDANNLPPPLNVESRPVNEGAGVRLRVSVSSPVELAACREVLPEADVGLDLHFQLQSPAKGIVRKAEQVLAYQKQIRETLGRSVDGKIQYKSLHVFAAVPVSVAFSLGQVLASTGLPDCYVYNFNNSRGEERPGYKWRLCLQAAVEGRASIKLSTLNPQGE